MRAVLNLYNFQMLILFYLLHQSIGETVCKLLAVPLRFGSTVKMANSLYSGNFLDACCRILCLLCLLCLLCHWQSRQNCSLAAPSHALRLKNVDSAPSPITISPIAPPIQATTAPATAPFCIWLRRARCRSVL